MLKTLKKIKEIFLYSGHIGLFIKQTKTAKYGNELKVKLAEQKLNLREK